MSAGLPYFIQRAFRDPKQIAALKRLVALMHAPVDDLNALRALTDYVDGMSVYVRSENNEYHFKKDATGMESGAVKPNNIPDNARGRWIPEAAGGGTPPPYPPRVRSSDFVVDNSKGNSEKTVVSVIAFDTAGDMRPAIFRFLRTFTVNGGVRPIPKGTFIIIAALSTTTGQVLMMSKHDISSTTLYAEYYENLWPGSPCYWAIALEVPAGEKVSCKLEVEFAS